MSVSVFLLCERVAGAPVERKSLDSVAGARRRQDLLFGESLRRVCSPQTRLSALFLCSVVVAVVAAILISYLLHSAVGIAGHGLTG